MKNDDDKMVKAVAAVAMVTVEGKWWRTGGWGMVEVVVIVIAVAEKEKRKKKAERKQMKKKN